MGQVLVRVAGQFAGGLSRSRRRRRVGRRGRRRPQSRDRRRRDGPGAQLRLPADHFRRQEVLPGRSDVRNPHPLDPDAPQFLQSR